MIRHENLSSCPERPENLREPKTSPLQVTDHSSFLPIRCSAKIQARITTIDDHHDIGGLVVIFQQVIQHLADNARLKSPAPHFQTQPRTVKTAGRKRRFRKSPGIAPVIQPPFLLQTMHDRFYIRFVNTPGRKLCPHPGQRIIPRRQKPQRILIGTFDSLRFSTFRYQVFPARRWNHPVCFQTLPRKHPKWTKYRKP